LKFKKKVYHSEGYFVKNEYNSYVINDRNATKNPDGSITINFGGDPNQPNFLYIMKGWQYLVRLYQPKEEILKGKWVFPDPEPLDRN
jgi:hypothetical protein